MRLLITSLLALLVTTAALAHGGHKHQFLGTVKALHENNLVVTTTEDKDVTFTLTGDTKYTKGAIVASKADLREGVRVSISVENDGTTVKTIKIAN